MRNTNRRKKSHVSKPLYFLSIAIVLVFNQGCSEEGSQKPDASTPISKGVVSSQVEPGGTSENKLINQAKQIVTKYRLSELSLNCLEFDVLEELFEGKLIIVIREKHGDSCEGDPNTSPRLFSIGIEQSTGVVWTDATSMLGQLKRLEME